MMKLLSIIVVWALSLQAQAQATTGDIVIGRRDSIYSHVLNEQRKILVHVPKAYKDASVQQHYPVVYLLDGHTTVFHAVSGIFQQLSDYNTLLPPMILVAVLNTKRVRDLTPTHSDYDLFPQDTGRLKLSGGGDNFLDFFEQELIPYIDSLYPTAPHRTLIRHSLGGVLVMHALQNRTNLFNAYIAIDPSMWWHQGLLVRQMDSSMQRKHYNNRSLFIGVANVSTDGRDTVAMKTDTSRPGSHTRLIFELTESLRKSTANGLKLKYTYYHEDDHGSVPLITIYDGLRFIFSSYRVHQVYEYILAHEKDPYTYLKVHFENASRQLGYTVAPPEWLLHHLAEDAIEDKNIGKASGLLRLSMEYYPNNAKTNEQMGDYYLAIGEKKETVAWYSKSVTIRDNPALQTKLADLQKEVASPTGMNKKTRPSKGKSNR